MSRRARQLAEDRALRDAALALVKDDIAHLRGDVREKGIVARIASSAALGRSLMVVSASPSLLISAATTSPPSARMRSAHACPIPDPPPVMSTRRPA